METGFTKRKQGQFRRFGRVLYGAGLTMQRALSDYIRDGDRPDQVIVLEHNPVFTLGRGAIRADIHVTDDFLAKNGVEVHQTDRGGQVTYHGPGQIVVYPVCNLRGGRQSVSRLVKGLEQAMINTANDFGVTAQRLENYPGVWVKTPRGWEKLGSLGINLKRWISTHGIAFNIDPHMQHFQWITPCGITEMGVCSLGSLLGDGCPTWNEVCTSLTGHLSEMLAFDIMPTVEPSQSVSVMVWRRGATDTEILMMLRCPSIGQWWSSVTGMIEEGETPETAAHREVLEETGLRGKLVPLDFQHTFWIDPALSGAQSDEPRFNTEICFQMEVPADQRVTLNNAEHTEYRWRRPDEALALMKWEGAKEALRLFLNHVTRPIQL